MSSTGTAPIVHPKRRRLRFSLRGVLVAIAVIAVLIWIPIQRAKNQKLAVEKIRELGGVVKYDFVKFGGSQPPAPLWLHRLLGDDFFYNVWDVSFDNSKINDEDLNCLRDFPQLENLALRGCKNLTDAALAPCEELAKLDYLDISDTNLGDGAIAQLRNCSQLTLLWANDTKLTDAGLVDAGALRKLRLITLARTQITDAGLRNLSKLKNLMGLDADGTQVTDHGLSALTPQHIVRLRIADTPHISDAALVEAAKFPNLRTLDLSDRQKSRLSPISTTGVAQLDGLKNLTYIGLAGANVDDSIVPHLLKHALQNLELSDTKLTDAGLAQLTSLTGLRSIEINNTAVTGAGLASLKSFPGLKFLELAGTQISDAGLVHVQPLTGLVTLNLDNTQITDAGLPSLAGLTSLIELRLGKTNITDAGLKNLASLSSLRLLRLDGTQVTDAGIAQLQQQLPQLRVER
jgi:internalin A